MYRLVVEENKTPFAVARELNRRGWNCYGRQWSHQNIYRILTHPKYAGYNVWNRTSRRLGSNAVRLPHSEWILKPMAFEPIVTPEVFEPAQRVLDQRTCSKSDGQLIDMLRDLLAANGRLTGRILENSPGAPSPSACRRRFGTLKRAFRLAGYPQPPASRQTHGVNP
jgi:Recombinase